MIKQQKKIKIPFEEKKFIAPNLRAKIFKEIYTGYTERYGLKLIYAYLNTDPELITDYCIIYTAKNDEGTGDLILFDIPPIHTDRSTPGYKYCRVTNQVDKWFEYGIDEMVIMDRHRFYEFLTMKQGLSLNKESEDYWKSPNNYKIVLEGLTDMSLYYSKKERVKEEVE